jgi:thiol:disulfide interchange protein DsbC
MDTFKPIAGSALYKNKTGSARARQGSRTLVSLFVGTAALLVSSVPTFAGDVDALRAALKEKLPNTEITSLRETPILGLFEMVTGKNLFYVDKTGSYSIIGTLYDLTSHEDLTAGRLTELGYAPKEEKAVEVAATSIPWDRLPKDAAIIENKGGTYKLAVFADINCPYCQHLADILRDTPEIEVHTYLITLWERSVAPTKAVLCAEDQVKALHAAYKNEEAGKAEGLTGKPTGPEFAENCTTDVLDQTTAFASQHGISGTPFLVRSDGATSAGLRSKEFLIDWLKGAEQ